MPVAFDTHLFIQRLQQGQMPLAQAEAVSAALQEALEERIGSLATKTDLDTVRTALTTDIADVRKDLGADIADVRKDLGADIADVRKDVKQLSTRLTWMIGANWALTLLILGKLLLFKA